MLNSGDNRTAGACAIVGTLLLFIGTYLHPMKADPNDALAAFAEYAADQSWVTSHLMQLAGVGLMVAALLFLAQQLESVSGREWSWVAAGGAIASLALTAALQAIDGRALKAMVDLWAAAAAEQKELAFHGALAIRQIEVGLASMASLMFGITATVYGQALLLEDVYPKWLGALAFIGGVSMIFAGVVMAYTGFSRLAMAINMSASSFLLIWMLTVGMLMWRRGRG